MHGVVENLHLVRELVRVGLGVHARAVARGADERADAVADCAVVHVGHDALLLPRQKRELLDGVVLRVDGRILPEAFFFNCLFVR